MDSKPVADMIEASSKVHFSEFHMDSLKVNNNEKPSTSLATDNVHKQPFIIEVAGGAASSKTTVHDMIIQQLHDRQCWCYCEPKRRNKRIASAANVIVRN
ncbi:hypothetical protein V6N12_012931 [Hibiscus sabdariffa]|uniref:Uncharacterized protein n=1 Tax=Hibiscus sabdariffa TaxID=183260 RepID=A0ABR2EI65_9ROSI